MKDKFGTILNVGDYIVYATRRGSTVNLIPAKVLAVHETKLEVLSCDSDWTGLRTYKTTIRVKPRIMRVSAFIHGTIALVLDKATEQLQ